MFSNIHIPLRCLTICANFLKKTLTALVMMAALSGTVASAEVVIGYVQAQDVTPAQTEWHGWFSEHVSPRITAAIRYHRVDDVEALNTLMNTYAMIDLAVLSRDHFRQFLGISGVADTMNIEGGFKMFARKEADAEVLSILEDSSSARLPAVGKEKPAAGQGQGNEDFVRTLYRKILYRDPDPGGLDFWTEQLDSGKITREQVTDAFKTSEEAR